MQLDQFLDSLGCDELLEIEAGAAPLARRDLIVLLEVVGSQDGEEKALAEARLERREAEAVGAAEVDRLARRVVVVVAEPQPQL